MNKFAAILGVLAALCPLPVFADGFSARIDAGVLVVNYADNLSGRGSETIDSLAAKPKSTTRIFPVPMFDLRYKHDKLRNTYYLGSTLDEPGGLAVGVSHAMDKGTFDTAFFASFIGKEWENPYLLKRTATDVRTFGFKAAWEKIAGSPVSLNYRITVKDLDRDLIGDLDSRLKRDGTTHRLEANYRLRLDETMTLVPAIAYERGASTGSANEFNGGSAACALIWRRGDVTWTNKLSGSYAAYDDKNPVFGGNRREKGYGLTSIAVFARPFGMEKVSFTIGYIHDQTFSTIDFFEKRADAGFALAGYSF